MTDSNAENHLMILKAMKTARAERFHKFYMTNRVKKGDFGKYQNELFND